MVFEIQRDSSPDTNAAMPIMAAFERRSHHKLQAIARVEQREEAQHDEVSACQPVPHQGERADKEAKEREGTIGQIQQALGNGFLLWKIRYSDQTVMQIMISTFASAPNWTFTWLEMIGTATSRP